MPELELELENRNWPQPWLYVYAYEYICGIVQFTVIIGYSSRFYVDIARTQRRSFHALVVQIRVQKTMRINRIYLNHRGLATYVPANYNIIGSGKDLSPVRRQAIIRGKADIGCDIYNIQSGNRHTVYPRRSCKLFHSGYWKNYTRTLQATFSVRWSWLCIKSTNLFLSSIAVKLGR